MVNTMTTYKENLIAESKKGKIIRRVNSFGFARYYLLDKRGICKKELQLPIIASMYL